MIQLIIEAVNKPQAANWFSRYHYTGTVGGSRFFLARCAVTGDALSMVAIGRGANRFGVAEKFGLERWAGNLEITRVACHVNAPVNTASKSIAAVCRVLASEGIEWLFSYSDTAQGHHGGIYQALNAVFVGTDARQWVNFELDGKRVSKRMVSGKFGHTRWPEVCEIAAAAGHVLRRVDWKPKLTYVLPISKSTKVNHAIRFALLEKTLPYPKRSHDITAMKTAYRNHRPAKACDPKLAKETKCPLTIP
jgi:hypothetical protein